MGRQRVVEGRALHPSRAVHVPTVTLYRADKSVLRHVRGALEHHVFEQMGKSRLPGYLRLPTS